MVDKDVQQGAAPAAPVVDENTLFSLKFVKTNGAYVPGDVAGFARGPFQRLVAGGFAVPEGDASLQLVEELAGRVIVGGAPLTPHGSDIEKAGQVWSDASRGQAGSLITTQRIDPATGEPSIEVIGGPTGELVSDAPGAGGTAAMATNTGGGAAAGADAGVVAPPSGAASIEGKAPNQDATAQPDADRFFTPGQNLGAGDGEGDADDGDDGDDDVDAADADVKIPTDWEHLPAKDRKALASKISGEEVSTVAEGDPIIREEEARREAPKQ